MASSRVRTMADLVLVVEDFRTHAQKMRWDDSEVALGSCDTAAASFINFASNARVRTKQYDLSHDLAELALLLGLDRHQLATTVAALEVEGCNYHQVSVVTLDDGTEVAIDWTARQFGANLPFPLVVVKDGGRGE